MFGVLHNVLCVVPGDDDLLLALPGVAPGVRDLLVVVLVIV